jgi:hypothetical protein
MFRRRPMRDSSPMLTPVKEGPGLAAGGLGGPRPRKTGSGEWSVTAPSEPPPVSSVALRSSLPLWFDLSGDVAVVIPTPRSEVCTAEGTAWRTDAASLELSQAHAGARSVTLAHNLPSSINLAPLLGKTLRVTLVHDEADNTNCGVLAAGSQTLSISGPGGRVWLVARFGPVHGVIHSVGGTEVRAALSQRPMGPLVVGTEQSQWLVYPECHVTLGGAAQGLVVEHVARPSTESAAYVIVESSLYLF